MVSVDRTRTSRSRRTPLGIGRRAARRFGHRSRPTQLRTLAAVMAVLFLVFGVDLIAKGLPPLTS